MTAYLLDDDEIHLLYLDSKLSKCANISKIGMHTNATIAIQEIETLLPEILFLDIDLGIANGLDLYRQLVHKPILILVTSQLDYALDGFELDAVDYLVKPYTDERIQKAVSKAEKYYANKDVNTPANTQLEGNAMFVKDGGTLHKILFDDVLYIEALGDFSEIHLKNKTKKITLVNLKYLEMQLPSHLFIRISRTCIIHIDSVTSLTAISVMIDAKELGIGKSYSEKVKETIVGNQTIKRNV
jgi:two-component system, LytTR family, response regulator